jgi:hypothetical protein
MNPPPLPTRKRFPWIFYWIVLVFIALFAFAPIGSVMTCAWIANSHGCKVDEGSVHPCIINGKDYGQLLYTLGVLGWLMLVTWRAGRVRDLVDHSHFASGKLAKEIRCRSSSSNSSTDANDMRIEAAVGDSGYRIFCG